MKHSILTAAFLVVTIASCTSENKNKQEGDTLQTTAADTLATATALKTSSSDCYVYIKNRDTANLKINIEGEELTGELSYKLFEKDSNTGKIAGEMRGDTIIAEYIFDSEGMRSVREVAFLKKADGNIYEGFGEVMEKDGKMVFKNHATLKFDSMIFTKTDCK